MSNTTASAATSESVNLGSIIWTSFKPMIKIYTILLLGYYFGKKNILDVSTARNVSYVNHHILLPSLIFSSIVTNLQYTDIKTIAIVCLNSFFYMIISGLIVVPIVIALRYIASKSSCHAVLSSSVFSAPLWKYGAIFLMVFSTGTNIVIAFLQSLQYNTDIFTTDEIDRGIAFVFIAFVCFDFVIYNLGAYNLVKMDFGGVKKVKPKLNEKLQNTSSSSLQDFPTTYNQNSQGKDKFETVTTEKPNNTKNSSSDDIGSISSSINSSALAEVEPKPFEKSQYHKHGTKRDHDNVSQSHSGKNAGSSTSDEHGQERTFGVESFNSSDDRHDNDGASSRHLQKFYSGVSQLSNLSAATTNEMNELRAIELRKLPSQNINDVVNEFSANNQSNGENRDALNLLHSLSIHKNHDQRVNRSARNNEQAVGLDQQIAESAKIANGKVNKSFQSHANVSHGSPGGMNRITHFLTHTFFRSCTKPAFLATLVSFVICMVPWLKNIFVATPSFAPVSTIKTHIKDAPDEYPPLNIFMNYCTYLGSSQVPISLFLLGSTFSRLDFINYNSYHDPRSARRGQKVQVKDIFSTIKQLYSTNLKESALNLIFFSLLAVIKLCILPIVGICWISSIKSKTNWFGTENEKVVIFVLCIIWALPAYTTQVYLTAIYTEPPNEDPEKDAKRLTQLHCLSCSLFIQFTILIVSFPFVSSFVLKRILNY